MYRRRRGWFIRRRPAQVKSTVAKSTAKPQYIYGYNNYGYPYGSSRASPSGCQWRYGYDYYGCTKKASTTTTKAPVKTTTTSGPGVYINPRRYKQKSVFNIFVIPLKALGIKACPFAEFLFTDVMSCRSKNNALFQFDKVNNYTEVWDKLVVKVQIVERPMGHCGLTISRMYNKFTIACLQGYGMKTSMSQKTDRVMHSGIVVETADHKKYLIHKGKKLLKGQSKKTVVQVADDAMFNHGYTKVGRNFEPRKLRSIREYYDESGSGYNFITDNCHDGTVRMIDLAKKP